MKDAVDVLNEVIAAHQDTIRQQQDIIGYERALADDLADVLAIFAPVVDLYLNAFEDGELMTLPEKLRLQEVEDANEKGKLVLARYREARDHG